MKIDVVERSEVLMEGHYEINFQTLESVIRTIGVIAGLEGQAVVTDAEGAEHLSQIDWKMGLMISPASTLSAATAILSGSSFSFDGSAIREVCAHIHDELAFKRIVEFEGDLQSRLHFIDDTVENMEQIYLGMTVRSSAFETDDNTAAIQMNQFNFLEIAQTHFNLRQAAQVLKVHCTLKPSHKQRYEFDTHMLLNGLSFLFSEALPTPKEIEDQALQIASNFYQKWRAQIQGQDGLRPISTRIGTRFQAYHSAVPLLVTLILEDVELTGVRGSLLSGLQIHDAEKQPLKPRITVEFMRTEPVEGGLLALPFTQRERNYVSSAITDMVEVFREHSV